MNVLDIIEDADCNADTCFVDGEGKQQPLGWAKRLVEIAFKAGYEQGKIDTELRTGIGQDKA